MTFLTWCAFVFAALLIIAGVVGYVRAGRLNSSEREAARRDAGVVGLVGLCFGVVGFVLMAIDVDIPGEAKLAIVTVIAIAIGAIVIARASRS